MQRLEKAEGRGQRAWGMEHRAEQRAGSGVPENIYPGLMIDDYENKHYPLEAPDPIEAIGIRMDEMNLK